MKTRTIASMCGVCPKGCGVNVHLVDGRIHRLTPLKNHPRGIVCPRGFQAKEVVYSPDRILYPQRRVGERGSGKFERISWNEAYDIIIDNLQRVAEKYGAEATGIYTGRGNFEYGLNEAFPPAGTAESSANAVLFPFGSPNTTGVGSLCYASYGMIAPRACFGDYMINMTEDIDRADLILVWGANPATDSPPIKLRSLMKARKRGAKIIVIDHLRNETAQATRAEWLGVRPGTDGALALGMIHVLIAENLYDHEFATQWTHGFDELSNYARAFSPERTAVITGIPAERIRQLAQQIAQAKGCSILTYTGLEYSNSGVQAIRAVLTLQALAGHLDVPGGKLFKMRDRPRTNRILTNPPPQAPDPIGKDDYPIYHEVRQEAHGATLPQAILENKPYPLRAMIVSGSSLITAWPNPDLWRRALAALDFLAVVNRFPTADSQYADIILPATTMFEIESYMIYDNYLQLRQRVIEPLGEARNDYLIFAELAERLGYGHLWPQTEEALIACALEDLDVSLADLRAHPEGLPLVAPEMVYRKYEAGLLRGDGRSGFNTPTGKFEISSEWFREFGYEPLPVYTEPTEGPLAAPEIAQQFPLVFNSGARTQFNFRSQHHNIPSLVSKHPDPLVSIHSNDAQTRGIKDGDAVYVITKRGRVPFRARVTADIAPGVIEANMGGGGPLGPPSWQKANVNDLTDFENRDPISGFPVYKALLCDVRAFGNSNL
ncbi:MAG: molybdopterin-dependent oxidoreductase [Chloroflexi bacterium]|nr:molybdopterin-dependent oxidoreductase [Chloroflexota bacterium]